MNQDMVGAFCKAFRWTRSHKKQNMDDFGWLGHNDRDLGDYWHMIRKTRFCFCNLGLGSGWRTRQYFWVPVGLQMLDSFLWESCDSIIWLAPTCFSHKWAKVIDSIIWVWFSCKSSLHLIGSPWLHYLIHLPVISLLALEPMLRMDKSKGITRGREVGIIWGWRFSEHILVNSSVGSTLEIQVIENYGLT